MKYALILAIALFAPTPILAQDQTEIQFVKSVLEPLQSLSFKKKREFCGYVGRLPSGELIATSPTRGRRNSCFADDPPEELELIASYHTHAGYTRFADSEVPSTADVEADMNEGVDGYVSTPGGRIWFIDGETGVSQQICGLSCTRVDARFEAEYFGPVEQSYTLKALKKREADG